MKLYDYLSQLLLVVITVLLLVFIFWVTEYVIDDNPVPDNTNSLPVNKNNSVSNDAPTSEITTLDWYNKPYTVKRKCFD